MKFKLLAIIVTAFAVGAGGALVFNGMRDAPKERVAQTTGKALIGGPFTMVDETGATVTEKDFAGRHSLMFFGFTYCPDVCPATLQIASEALELLGPDAKHVQPVFVSVDPERDTPAVLRSYLEDFDPRIKGLTGTKAQVASMAKTYRIYHAKVADPNSEGGYTVDHSAYMYLMSPDGTYITHFPPAIQAEELAKRLGPVLKRS